MSKFSQEQISNESCSRYLHTEASSAHFAKYEINKKKSYAGIVASFELKIGQPDVEIEHLNYTLAAARNAYLRIEDRFMLAEHILSAVSGFPDAVKLQVLIGECLRYLPMEKRYSSLLIAEMLLTLEEFKLVEWVKRGDNNSHYIKPLICNDAPKGVKLMYPLPSLVKGAKYSQEVFPPKQYTQMYEGTMKIQENIMYKLHPVLAQQDPQPPKTLVDTWEDYVEQYEYAMRAMSDKEFCFEKKSCSRGRTYSRGHHINPQGMEYQKALLDRAEGEYLTPAGVFWLKVAIANAFGLSKEVYSHRIAWVNAQPDLKAISPSAKEKYLFWKFADALEQHRAGKKVYCPIPLDEVSSGTQYIGLMLNCEKSLIATNVIMSEGGVNDPRTMIYAQILEDTGMSAEEYGVTHQQLKDCVMQYAYAGTKTIEDTFDFPDEFYNAIDTVLPALRKYIELTKPLNVAVGVGKEVTLPNGWWTLPLTPDAQIAYDIYDEGDPEREEIWNKIDNHDWVNQGFKYRYNAKPIPKSVVLKLSNNKSCTFQYKERVEGDHNLGLSAHIVHSVEAMSWQRAVYLTHMRSGYGVDTVHDEGWVPPNGASVMSDALIQAKQELAASNVLADIVNQFRHEYAPYKFEGERLDPKVINGIYSLC